MSYTWAEEQIEQDELNQHKCMLPLMRLIDHLHHNKITPEVPEVYTYAHYSEYLLLYIHVRGTYIYIHTTKALRTNNMCK